MANLLDIINQNKQNLTKAPAQTDETQKLQGLLRAKTGKAVGGGSTPAISNIGEQAANQATATTLQTQVSPQIQLQAAANQQAQQAATQQEAQQTQAVQQSRKFDNIQTKMKTAQIMNDLSRDKASLDLDKDKSRLEQASFLLSMQDKSYTDQLADIGARRRLDDAANFNQELQDMIMQDQAESLKSQLGTNDILAVNDRQFKKAMSEMSIDDAMKMADAAMANESIQSEMRKSQYTGDAATNAAIASGQMTAQGLQGLLTGGLQGYSAYKNMPKEEEEG